MFFQGIELRGSARINPRSRSQPAHLEKNPRTNPRTCVCPFFFLSSSLFLSLFNYLREREEGRRRKPDPRRNGPNPRRNGGNPRNLEDIPPEFFPEDQIHIIDRAYNARVFCTATAFLSDFARSAAPFLPSLL